MSYLAKIEGTYKHRTRINLLFFSIVGPWKTETFSFEKTVPAGTLQWVWKPAPNVPISAAVDLTPGSATFSLQVLEQSFPVRHVSFPVGMKQSFHFEVVKGNLVDGTASVVEV